MKTFFQDNQSDELILLFNGWGMDEKPFAPLKSCCDILFVHDYTNLFFDFEFDFLKYKKITLLCFSAGVYMAGALKNILPECDLKIAINGTLATFNHNKGMPKEICEELENISMDNVFEFRNKLIEDEKHLELFNKYQPARDLENSISEFYALKKHFSDFGEIEFAYDKVIISEDDKIMPCQNQLRAWGDHKNTCQLSGGHFLFYKFSDIDEIINL